MLKHRSLAEGGETEDRRDHTLAWKCHVILRLVLFLLNKAKTKYKDINLCFCKTVTFETQDNNF